MMHTVKQLPISLEDLYKGCTKKLKVTKKKLNGTEESNTLESTSLSCPFPLLLSYWPALPLLATVAVKPGWKAGTKVRFAHAGHETPGGAQDMVFVIGEKDHPTFKRDGDDLIYTVKVPLVEALAGPDGGGNTTKTVTHLDGRTVSVNIPYPRGGGNPIKPGQIVKVVGEVRLPSILSLFPLLFHISWFPPLSLWYWPFSTSQGMPITRKNAPRPKGDLLVKLDVVFPDRISAAQAEGIRKVLG
jgi:DnaJ family protein B protein 4